jgi:hypothetical protein
MKDLKNIIKNTIRDYLIENRYTFNNYDEIIDDILLNHEIDMSYEFNDIEDARDYLIEFTLNDLNNLPEEVTLYRVIVVDDKSNIDLNKIGLHYVLNKNKIYDIDFLYNIGISSIDDSKLDKLWCIELIVNKNDIDLNKTLLSRFMYPEEEEITLKEDFKPIDYKIEKYELY